MCYRLYYVTFFIIQLYFYDMNGKLQKYDSLFLVINQLLFGAFLFMNLFLNECMAYIYIIVRMHVICIN